MMQRIGNNSGRVLNAICLEGIPIALIFLFMYTGTSKLIGHAMFLDQLDKISFLKGFSVFISYFIPIAEIVIALLLGFRSSRILGLVLSVSFMGFFTGYVIFILSGDLIPCSCGGVISALSWSQHLYFNIAFLILSLASLFCNKFLHVYKEVS